MDTAREGVAENFQEKEEEDKGEEEEPVTKKKRRIKNTEQSRVYHRKRLLVKEQDLLPVQDALEHAIVTGSQVRREYLRRKVYYNQQRRQEEQQLPHVQVDENETVEGFYALQEFDDAAATTTMTTVTGMNNGMTATESGTANSHHHPEQQEEQHDIDGDNGNQLKAPANDMTAAAASSLPSEDATVNSSSTKRSSASKKSSRCNKRSIIEHTGDIRIYGRRSTKLSDRGYYPMKAWPRDPDGRDNSTATAKGIQNASKRTRHDNLDSEWNYQYGDSIPPVLFRLARLSGEHPTPKQQTILDNVPPHNKTLQSTDISVPLECVPRAILEKCWERAVHIASNTVAVAATPDKETETNDIVDGSVQGGTLQAASTANTADKHQRPSSEQQAQTALAPLPAQQQEEIQPTVLVYLHERKCCALGIALENAELTECPRCTRIFQTPSDLKQHYYGKLVSTIVDAGQEDAKEYACCLPLIRARVLETMNELLQPHVQSQTDQIMSIVLSGAAANFNSNDNG
ncbi:MAG: hypothetical protein SGARI_001741, partial [Bacillariaceae sp.]